MDRERRKGNDVLDNLFRIAGYPLKVGHLVTSIA